MKREAPAGRARSAAGDGRDGGAGRPPAATDAASAKSGEAARLAFELNRAVRRVNELETAFRLWKSDAEAELDDLRYRQTPWPARALRTLRSFVGVPLRPGVAAAGRLVGTGPDAWTGMAAQQSLAWPGARPLEPGHYRVSLRLDGLPQMQTPCITAFAGRDGDRSDIFLLSPDASGTALVGELVLSQGARRLYFDPGVGTADLSAARIRLRRMSRLEAYARMAFRAWSRHARGKGAFGVATRRARALLQQGGVRAFAAQLRRAGHVQGPARDDYQRWIRVHERFSQVESGELRRRLRQLEARPLVSVLVPAAGATPEQLRESLESVSAQLYPNWEVCLAGPVAGDDPLGAFLAARAAENPRVVLVETGRAAARGELLDLALGAANGTWVAVLSPGDLLSPTGLAEAVLAVADRPGLETLYSDEDTVSAAGKRSAPRFKPDFSRELLRSQDYFGGLTLHRAATVRAAGGWGRGRPGAEDYDLALRMFEIAGADGIGHVPRVLYHVREVPAPGEAAVRARQEAGLEALSGHLARTGLAAAVEPAPGTDGFRLRPALPDPAPLASLVIPTRDRVELLRGCVESILEKTTYPNYEIVIVDNGSVEKATLDYFEALRARPGVRVLPYDRPFNYSAINNFAVREARGSVIALVNNDIVVIEPDWLTEMVSWAALPDVGCVGAKLYYDDDTVQHAGVILGLGGVAGHAHRFFPRDHPGYCSRLKLVHNLSAVTGACLVVRKEVYLEVGGLNERDLTVAYNDVDFCLKVREAGYSNVWTPYAELYHLESVSRGSDDSPQKARRYQAEVAYLQRSWPLTPDPFYSVNLTLDREDFSLAN